MINIKFDFFDIPNNKILSSNPWIYIIFIFFMILFLISFMIDLYNYNQKIKNKVFNNLPILKKMDDNVLKAIKFDLDDYDYSDKYKEFMLADDFNIETIIKNKKMAIPKKNNKFIINSELCIGITVKNIAKGFEKNIKMVEMICSLFKKSSIIFFEDGSKDDTVDKINKYCSKNKFAMIISEINDVEYRTVRLSRARNICLKIARYLDPTYYLVVDFDSIAIGLTKKGFLSIFKRKEDWGSISANSKNDYYYDIWALRTKDDFLNYDFWDYKYDKSLNKIKIKPSQFLEVVSAFGGLAIYKMSYTKNCFYYGFKNNKEHCEHVHFHKKMTSENNAKHYILGKLTVN